MFQFCSRPLILDLTDTSLTVTSLPTFVSRCITFTFVFFLSRGTCIRHSYEVWVLLISFLSAKEIIIYIPLLELKKQRYKCRFSTVKIPCLIILLLDMPIQEISVILDPRTRKIVSKTNILII